MMAEDKTGAPYPYELHASMTEAKRREMPMKIAPRHGLKTPASLP
jgi:hypothetical protein